ncbi:ABC transporter ATP-binding protein [Methylocapsa sp. S129]|uniref:ABC transporter ATP-binding protein n=1 Tax=Methylocapsa sp. S129 TaxID=1641869 RepID=UPI00131DC8FF|nr:ABC transporter ATP-binding protein [Methylocapsa sp. S129]
MALLEVNALDAFYGDFQALFGVSLKVEEGQIVSVIGANGAGKSTLLQSIAGLIKSAPDMIAFDGAPIGAMRAPQLVRQGIALIPEGRRLFSSLSVGENLLVGGQVGRPGPWTLDRVFDLFPNLKHRKDQRSTSLSGGEQQMVAFGRALMTNPRLLLCDELSLGLAPIVVKEIFARLPEIVREGVTVVIVEQDIVQALSASSHVYCLQEGRVTLGGPPAQLSREAIKAAYFGV